MRYGVIMDVWIHRGRMWSFGFFIDLATVTPYVSVRFGTGVWYFNLPKRKSAK